MLFRSGFRTPHLGLRLYSILSPFCGLCGAGGVGGAGGAGGAGGVGGANFNKIKI